MSDQSRPNGEVLDYLKARFDRLDARFDAIGADVRDIKLRLSLVESQVGQLAGAEQTHYAVTMQRIDGLERRLDRIEKRLDLVDAPP